MTSFTDLYRWEEWSRAVPDPRVEQSPTWTKVRTEPWDWSIVEPNRTLCVSETVPTWHGANTHTHFKKDRPFVIPRQWDWNRKNCALQSVIEPWGRSRWLICPSPWIQPSSGPRHEFIQLIKPWVVTARKVGDTYPSWRDGARMIDRSRRYPRNKNKLIESVSNNQSLYFIQEQRPSSGRFLSNILEKA